MCDLCVLLILLMSTLFVLVYMKMTHVKLCVATEMSVLYISSIISKSTNNDCIMSTFIVISLLIYL